MQIHQLKYLIVAADHSSFRAAANSLYVSQSSVSVALKDLEQELGVTIFERTSRGTTLTAAGAELVERARAVVEQIDALADLYPGSDAGGKERMAVSSQHYSLVVDAFGDFIQEHAGDSFEYSLRESYTNEIIRDVQERRSNLGVIYLSNYNDRAIGRALASAGLTFTSLYVVQPHIIVSLDHPLAKQKKVSLEELEAFPRFEKEQGLESSSYFAEEPLVFAPAGKRIVVSDNSTLSTLLQRTDGYALGTGAFPEEGTRFASVPIDTDETMNVGFIQPEDSAPGPLVEEFLGLLCKRIAAAEGPMEISAYVRERA